MACSNGSRGAGPLAQTPGQGGSSIAFGSEILWPIDGIAAAVNQVVVLGQTVDINAATVFDANLIGGLGALSRDDVVEICSLFDAAGHYTATRIERKGTTVQYAGPYKLRGIVASLDAVISAFSIGSARISYNGLIGPSTLGDGSFVRLRLLTTQDANGRWAVAEFRDGAQQPRDQDEVEVEGRIGGFDSPTRFSVNGIAVDASGITPASTGPALGVRVLNLALCCAA